MIYSKKPFISESASSAELGHNPEDLKPNSTGFEAIDVEDYFGISLDNGVARDEALRGEENAYGDFFRNPIVMEAFNKYLDLTDDRTRRRVLSMNEAEQNSALVALTSRLYDNIVSKIDDIDYGEIPMSKGDVTKLSNYDKLRECIMLLQDIMKEYRQNDGPIKEIAVALANVESRKELFMRSFKTNTELGIVLYNTAVLNIIASVSYMISTCIEFIKTPNQDSFQITLDKVALNKTKGHTIYNTLKAFNKSCDKGDIDKAVNHVIKTRVNHEAGVLATVGTVLSIAVLSFAALQAALFFLRESVFFFYYIKMRVSEFFEIQADLLQINAHNLENSNMNDEEKKRTVAKQMKIVDWLRKMSNKFSIDARKAEVDTEKEIEADDRRKTNIDDIDNHSSIF